MVEGEDAYEAYVERKREREAGAVPEWAVPTAGPVEPRPWPGPERPERGGLRRLAWAARLPLGGFSLYYAVAAVGCARWAADNGWSPVWSALLGPLFLAALGWLPALVILGVLSLVGAALDGREGRP